MKEISKETMERILEEVKATVAANYEEEPPMSEEEEKLWKRLDEIDYLFDTYQCGDKEEELEDEYNDILDRLRELGALNND